MADGGTAKAKVVLAVVAICSTAVVVVVAVLAYVFTRPDPEPSPQELRHQREVACLLGGGTWNGSAVGSGVGGFGPRGRCE